MAIVSSVQTRVQTRGARACAIPPKSTATVNQLCAMATDTFAEITPPIVPSASGGGIISNAPIVNPCSSLFELLYERQLYTAAHVLRVGLGRESTMLFDPFTAITLLAPSEQAFARMNLNESSAPNPTWTPMAEAHVLPGTITSRDIACSKRGGSFTLDAQTWNSKQITLRIDKNATLTAITHAGDNSPVQVEQADVPACLSVLHVLDRVIDT